MKKNVVKFLVLLVCIMINSCEKESTCKTEIDCYNDGNGGQSCVERPIPGTCIDNSFTF